MYLNILLFLLAATETDIFTPFPSGVTAYSESEMVSIDYSGNEGFLSSEPGSPLLPIISRVYLLPGKCSISAVDAQLVFDSNPISSGRPVRAAVPVRPVGSSPFSERLPSLCSISGMEPLISFHCGTILNTYTIVSISVNPWRYSPGSGELYLAGSCAIEFEWNRTSPQITLSRIQAEAVQFRIDQLSERFGTNRETVTGYDSDIDYLIITGDALEEPMSALTELLETRSLSWEMLSVQDIEGAWSGNDIQEDVRNCIRYYAFNRGTAFVLLAGDEDVVPVREVYTECEGYSETAPSDLYYADLDGTWDLNGNGVFGESADSLDLYADVILGRLLFSTPEEVEVVLGKNLEYAGAGESAWYRQAVLCGALLFPDIGYTAARGCELTGEEFPSDFTLIKAYEISVGDYPDTYLSALYSGAGWNHYAGHGSENGIWWADFSGIMTIQRTYGFDNPGRYGIHSSIGCHTGDFTSPTTFGCLADTLLTIPDGGGIACFFNTTWGWEGFWPEIGSSERLCLNTVQQVYHQKASSLGLAYTAAKDLEIPLMSGPYDRVMQSVLAYSAFMEPSLEVLGVANFNPFPPQPFRIVINGPVPAISGILPFKVTGPSPSYDVSIHDISGRKVIDTFSLQQNALHNLDTSGLVPGVYFISAESPGDRMITESFVRLR